MSRTFALLCCTALGLISATAPAQAYDIDNWWSDGDDVVMDDVFLPANVWSAPAQYQMSEYNEIDVTDNSHPFRINLSPQFSFGAYDGDNTIGFLGEAGLNSEYGLSYANALAWTVCWSDGRIEECDVMLDPTLPWSLEPDDAEWFQSTVLHELGHVRGLDHYNSFLSMQNSGTSKYLRAETLYMDDKEGIRQNASHVQEYDMTIYEKWHDGSLPHWMTMSPTTVREGQTVDLSGITVENRGTEALTSGLRVGFYLSPNATISTSDQLLNAGSWGGFGRFTYSTFDWSVQIPSVNDCATRYLGGIIDDNDAWGERFEGNNSVVFTNGVPFTGSNYTPTPLSVLLREDVYEPDNSTGAASTIGVPFDASGLSIDEDEEQDYFRLSLGCREQLDAEIRFSHSYGDIDLDLRDSANAIIAISQGTDDIESISQQLDAGVYYVRSYGFGFGSCNHYSISLRATDTTAPAGSITFPPQGYCSAGPVTIATDFDDACDGAPVLDFEPPPGPTYDAHGDYLVTVTASDASGNAATDSVEFTIDRVEPAVTLLAPGLGLVLAQPALPFGVLFTATDEDGATGSVVREQVFLAGCLVYDGSTYGDADGLLSDESLSIGSAELCRVADLCGFSTLVNPTLAAVATDCAGNRGMAARSLRGTMRLLPGLCGPP